jgi:hypothetical protein
MELDMTLRATSSLTTSAGMGTSSRISSFYETTMKTFLTLTTTSIIWGRMVHREVTWKYMQQLGFMTTTSQFTHWSTLILVDFLVFKASGPKGTCNTPNKMWNISYHGNNHFNSIQSPENSPHPSQHKTDLDCYQAYMQNASDNYQDNFTKLALLSFTNGTPIPLHDIN